MKVLAIALLVGLCSWIAVAAATWPVGSARFSRFVERQRLPLWVPDVIECAPVRRYLATTRRWRVAGLAVAVCFSITAGLRLGRLGVDLSAMFMGWFIGAVIAEWRLRVRPEAVLRRASLTPRRAGAYLGLAGRFVPWLVTGAVVATVGVNVLIGRTLRWQNLIVLALVLIPAAMALVAGRHVLLRPAVSPEADAQIIDFALRSRSLHALSGAVIANGTFALTVLVWVSPVLDPSGSIVAPLIVFGVGLFAMWWVAVRPVASRLVAHLWPATSPGVAA